MPRRRSSTARTANVELYLVEFGASSTSATPSTGWPEKGVTVVHVNSTVPWDGPGDGTVLPPHSSTAPFARG